MSEILFLSRIAVTVGERGREIMQGTYSNVQVS
jgi:hypothetical protein